MSEPRILVIGEKFVDKYFVGTATRLSPEAPIPVVAVKEVIQFDGGAANVAKNLEALGVPQYMYNPGTVSGYETVKNRLMVGEHQLARWDEHDTVTPIQFMKAEDFKGVDAVIISDYGKGGFTGHSIRHIHDVMAGQVKYVFVDTKQEPDHFSFYPRDTFFFPNMKEYRQHEDQYSSTKNVVRTESEAGMTHIQYGVAKWHLDTKAKEIVSVCGAGDTAIAAFAYEYCKTQDVVKSMRFATKACAVVCAKPYTAVASHEEINKITG